MYVVSQTNHSIHNFDSNLLPMLLNLPKHTVLTNCRPSVTLERKQYLPKVKGYIMVLNLRFYSLGDWLQTWSLSLCIHFADQYNCNYFYLHYDYHNFQGLSKNFQFHSMDGVQTIPWAQVCEHLVRHQAHINHNFKSPHRFYSGVFPIPDINLFGDE